MTIIKTAKVLQPRRANDFYETPVELCRAALFRPVTNKFQTILDAGAGTGNWGFAARENWPQANLIGMELDPKRKNPGWYNDWIPADYPHFAIGQVPDLIIGNPPYKQAEEFIWQAHNQLAYGGGLIFLLRLAFLESVSRGRGLWQKWPPYAIRVLMQRPSFTGDGKTDDTAYAVFYWRRFKQKSDARRVHPKLGWLDWRD